MSLLRYFSKENCGSIFQASYVNFLRSSGLLNFIKQKRQVINTIFLVKQKQRVKNLLRYFKRKVKSNKISALSQLGAKLWELPILIALSISFYSLGVIWVKRHFKALPIFLFFEMKIVTKGFQNSLDATSWKEIEIICLRYVYFNSQVCSLSTVNKF